MLIFPSTHFFRTFNFSSFSPKGKFFKRCVVRVIKKKKFEILNQKIPSRSKVLSHEIGGNFANNFSCSYNKEWIFFCLLKYILQKLKRKHGNFYSRFQTLKVPKYIPTFSAVAVISTNEFKFHDMPLHQTLSMVSNRRCLLKHQKRYI